MDKKYNEKMKIKKHVIYKRKKRIVKNFQELNLIRKKI